MVCTPLQIAEVLLMLGITFRVGPDVCMTVLTLDHIRVLIPGRGVLPRAVELLAVAFGTGHAGTSPVDISGDTLIFPEVFSTDAGTVAGHAVVLCRGSPAELVVRKQSATHFIGSANMALTASSVALLAVILESCG